MHEKDVVGIVTFDSIGLQQSHYFIYVLLLFFFKKTCYFHLFLVFIFTSKRQITCKTLIP